MILNCPACATRYLVPDSAIGPTGRQVRCASCRHSWFEAPPQPEGYSPDFVAGDPEVSSAQPARVFGDDDFAPMPDGAGEYPAFDPDFRPRRNPARLWTIAAAVAAVVLLAALAALFAFGPARFTHRFGAGGATPPLTVQVIKFDRQTMKSGNELLEVTGRVSNPTAASRSVPEIHAELHDRAGRLVYNWTIPRPVGQLAPGTSADFDSAAVDVPNGAAELKLSLGGAAR